MRSPNPTPPHTTPHHPTTPSPQVNSSAGIAVGQWVRVNLNNPADCSLARDLNGGYMGCGSGVAGAAGVVRHLSRVTAVGPGWIR